MGAVIDGRQTIEPDPNQCDWRLPSQCRNLSQWQVTTRSSDRARVCHSHLLDTCQTWASMAPLFVEPIFSNWMESIVGD